MWSFGSRDCPSDEQISSAGEEEEEKKKRVELTSCSEKVSLTQRFLLTGALGGGGQEAAARMARAGQRGVPRLQRPLPGGTGPRPQAALAERQRRREGGVAACRGRPGINNLRSHQ